MWWLVKIPSCWKAILREKTNFRESFAKSMFNFHGGYTLQKSSWLRGLAVLHSSLSTSIKHHFGSAGEVEVLQGRLARTLNRHHWMNQQNWWRRSWKSYQLLLRSCLARSVAAWLGQGFTKQAFTLAYAFANLSPKNVASLVGF